MAELTLGAVRAAAEACARAWGGAQVTAVTRDEASAPRFDVVVARWPVLGSADALALALEATTVDRPVAELDAAAPGMPALALWIATARVRAAAAPYDVRIAEWARRATARVPGGPAVAWRDVSARLAGLVGDAATRRALGVARARLGASEFAPLARERVARSCAAVDALGVGGGYDETFARLTGTPPGARTALAAEWLARTAPVWDDVLAERARRTLGLPVRELHASDLPAVLAAADDAVPLRGSALAASVRTQLAAMGIDPDARGRLRARPVVGAVDGVVGRATGDRSARAVPVRVPDEVYLLVRPSADADAPRAYVEAYGRALHLVHTDATGPFEARWQANARGVRATGALFTALLRDRGWLRRYAGLSGAALERTVRAAAFRELAAVRTAAARAEVSAAAYGDSVALGDVVSLYVDRMGAALGVVPEAGDALSEVDLPFAIGASLRSALTAGVLYDALRERFDDDWWRNPRAGPWLATEWFAAAPAARAPADLAPLVAALTRALE